MTTEQAEPVAAEPTVPEPVAVDVDKLRTTLTEAEAAVTAVEAKLADIKASPEMDVDALLAAANEVTAARDKVKRAKNALDRALFEERSEERLAAVHAVQESIRGSNKLMGQINAAKELGVVGFTLHFAESGELLIDSNVPKAAATVKGTGRGGGSRGQNSYELNGTSYTARELISTFGDQQYEPGWAQTVFDRASAGAGFDQPVKALAKKLGIAYYTKKDGTKVDL